MKTYPSIKGPSKAPHQPCIAFYKYDGSNLRFEWNRKIGWVKFGTRKRLFDESDPDFGSAVSLFKDTLAQDLESIFRKHYRDDKVATAYCEFFGENSFAGAHEPNDPKRLVLFDVEIYKKGFVSPRDFVNIFSRSLGDRAAEVVYEGNLNESFIHDVRTNSVEGVNLIEGVVCKGGSGHKLWRCKIKCDSYKEKLKESFGGRWHEFWEGDSE
jgi:hypothetical protein